MPSSSDAVKKAAQGESIESLLETFTAWIKLYYRIAQNLPKMVDEDVSKDVPGFLGDVKSVLGSSKYPELHVPWTKPLAGEITEMVRRLDEAFSELHGVRVEVKTHVRAKIKSAEAKRALLDLQRDLDGADGDSGGWGGKRNIPNKRLDLLKTSRTKLIRAVSALRERQRRDSGGGSSSFDASLYADRLEKMKQQELDVLISKYNPLNSSASAGWYSDTSRSIEELRKMVEDALAAVKADVANTPAEEAFAAAGGGSDVTKKAPPPSSSAPASTMSLDTVSAKKYLKWKDSLESDLGDAAVSDRSVSVFQDMQRHGAAVLFDKDGAGGLNRPYEGLEPLLQAFASVFADKARHSKFVGAVKEGGGEGDQVQELVTKVERFVSNIRKLNRDVLPEYTEEMINSAVDKGLGFMWKRTEDLLQRYVTYLKRKKMPVKTPSSRSGVAGDSSATTGGPLDWPTESVGLMSGGDGEVAAASSGGHGTKTKQASENAPEFMYRSFDRRLAVRFTQQVHMFADQLLSSVSASTDEDEYKGVEEYAEEAGHNLVESRLSHAREAIRDAHERVAALDRLPSGSDRDDTAEIEHRKNKVWEGVYESMKSLADGYETQLEQYLKTHADFLWNSHRDGFRYMTYWRRVKGSLSPDDLDVLQNYFENLKKVRTISNNTLKGMQDAMNQHVKGYGGGGGGEQGGEDGDKKTTPRLSQWSHGLKVDQREEVIDRISEALQHTEKVRKRISDMYHGKGRTMAETLTSIPMFVLIGMKLLRLLFLYAGLDYAERRLQTTYAREVYGRNRDPPHPFRLVVTALLIEASLNLVTVLLLYLLRVMFGSGTGRVKIGGSSRLFSLDNSFFMSLFIDYVATTLVLLLITGVASAVIRKKKYFRYRYEGERGIRALSSIVMGVAVPVFLVPFARVV